MINLLYNSRSILVSFSQTGAKLLLFGLMVLFSIKGFSQTEAVYTLEDYYGSRFIRCSYDGAYITSAVLNDNNGVEDIIKISK